MRELVGVRPRFRFDPLTIKRDALFFKRIAVPQDPNLAKAIELRIARAMGLQHDQHRSGLLDVPDWLYDEEFLFEPRFSYRRELLEGNEEYREQFDASVERSDRAYEILARNEEVSRRVNWIINLDDETQQKIERRRFFTEMQGAEWAPTVRSTMQELELGSEHNARAMAIQLREEDGMNTLPVLDREMSNPQGNKVSEQDVIQVVLNALPVPDGSVAWEQIREFRSDQDSQRKFLALRRWMNRFAEGRYVFTDAAEEIEDLISAYTNHLRVHRFKTAFIRLAVVLHLGAAALDKKTGPIATALVTYAFGRISLMEDESGAAGSEVAYIVKAARDFE